MARKPRKPDGEPRNHADGVAVNGGQSESGDNGHVIDPSAVAGAAQSGPGADSDGNADRGGDSGTRRKRSDAGARRGPRKKTPLSFDVGDLGEILLTGHAMLATLVRVRELELDKSEADKLAEKLGDVLTLYDMPGVSPKTKAWINLALVGGGIYGTRIMAYNLRKATERPPSKVVPIRPVIARGNIDGAKPNGSVADKAEDQAFRPAQDFGIGNEILSQPE